MGLLGLLLLCIPQWDPLMEVIKAIGLSGVIRYGLIHALKLLELLGLLGLFSFLWSFRLVGLLGFVPYNRLLRRRWYAWKRVMRIITLTTSIPNNRINASNPNLPHNR